MMRSSSRILAAVPLLVLPALITFARLSHQQSVPTTDGDLRVLTVTVRNGAGNYVMGLPREAFELTDEKERRPIEFFENADTPVSIGILIDTSASMQFYEVREIARFGPLGDAISRFLELSNPDNEYFLMAFDKTPRLLADWASSQALLAHKTDIGPLNKNTALYDACFAAVDKLLTTHYSKRVLILISDGQDNASHHSFNQLRELLRNSDTTVYGIGVFGGSDVGSTLGMEGAGIMRELAETTGGEVLFVGSKKELKQVIESLSIQLRHQYRMGFRVVKTDPSNKWHRLKLRVTPRTDASAEFKKLTVRTRQGYYTR